MGLSCALGPLTREIFVARFVPCSPLTPTPTPTHHMTPSVRALGSFVRQLKDLVEHISRAPPLSLDHARVPPPARFSRSIPSRAWKITQSLPLLSCCAYADAPVPLLCCCVFLVLFVFAVTQVYSCSACSTRVSSGPTNACRFPSPST